MFHFFLSSYSLDFRGALDVERNEAALGLPSIVIQDDFDDNSDNSAANHNVDVSELPCSFKTQDMMRLACFRWRLACSEFRESWKVRANYLNSKPLPGRFIALPPALRVNIFFYCAAFTNR